MALAISFQTFAYSETKYYPTGEVQVFSEYVNGKLSKATFYHKTGEVDQVDEYVNGKISKVTGYHKTGKVGQIQEFINGKKSKETFYYKTGEINQVQEYINDKKSKTTFYSKTGKVTTVRDYTTSTNTKDNQASFSNKVSNKKTVITCIGNLYDMGIAVDGRYAQSMESYWEDVIIIGDVLTAPKFGDYIYRGEEDDKKYWKTSTGAFDTGNPADDKWNWAVLDTNTYKFDISVKKGTIDVMQGKCSPKDKTNWNWN